MTSIFKSLYFKLTKRITSLNKILLTHIHTHILEKNNILEKTLTVKYKENLKNVSMYYHNDFFLRIS